MMSQKAEIKNKQEKRGGKGIKKLKHKKVGKMAKKKKN
jgi:hypothetical protein